MNPSRAALFLLALLFLIPACLPGQRRALLDADGTRRWLTLREEETVAELLATAGLQLTPGDRVEPPSFTLLEPEMQVRVVRVRERELQEEQILPFDRELRRDASLPQGESRVAQLGQNGRERVTFRLTLENGREVARELVARETLVAPVSEVLVVGTRGSGSPLPFGGTIVYLEQGNGWLMRGDSSQKRPLTRTGDLDGHVFALSPDGRWLLFSREPIGGASGQGGPLNSLWLVNTRIAGDEPRSLDVASVLWAGWEPCPARQEGCPRQIAYSTAERVPTPPGWRANNDLFRIGLNEEGVRGEAAPLLSPSNPLFGWWGRSWAWSPDGRWIAWGDATRLGVVEVASGEERLLAEFLPFETGSPWVWTPQLAWSPDSQGLVAAIHRAGDGVAPERAERFDLMRIRPEGGRVEPVASGVGPFPMPLWLDRQRLLYGQVEDRTTSATSRYELVLQVGEDAARPLFPPTGQPRVDVPWSAWNPLDQAVIAVWQGDLYLVPVAPGRPPRPLTAEGGASRPQWAP